MRFGGKCFDPILSMVWGGVYDEGNSKIGVILEIEKISVENSNFRRILSSAGRTIVIQNEMEGRNFVIDN
jgi:hypothetical protein